MYRSLKCSVKPSVLAVMLSVFVASCVSAPQEDTDLFLWLEGIENPETTQWVARQNKRTIERLTNDSRFDALESKFLNAYDNLEQLAVPGRVVQHRGMLYELAQTELNPRGVLRRGDATNYGTPHAKWQNILDIDELATEEGRNWYSSTGLVFSPDGKRALVHLTEGGSDASSYREFDLVTLEFVPGGFYTPIARQFVEWLDNDTLLIAIVLDETEKTLADYPRMVRRWQRNTPLNTADVILEIAPENLVVTVSTISSESSRHPIVINAQSFSNATVSMVDPQGAMTALPIPPDTAFSAIEGPRGLQNKVLFTLANDWQVTGNSFRSGDVISLDLTRVIAGNVGQPASAQLVYRPKDREALSNFGAITATSNAVYLHVMKDVQSMVKRGTLDPKGNWVLQDVELPSPGSARFPAVSDTHASSMVMTFESFLAPPAQFRLSKDGQLTSLHDEAVQGASDDFEVQQFFATANDGEKIPYFLLKRKGLKLAGDAPVMMYGYGAFGLSVLPSYELPYIGSAHRVWLENSGVFVSVHPRGGGEYGPQWHTAAKGVKRQIAYNDIYAVTEDLIQRQVTTAGKIGFVGGSNGGLTAGVLATQRPDLFGAAIAMVPLLDMARFHKLLAGASWINEYGDPEKAIERAALLSYSPYHNLSVDISYPEIFLMTSTKDDRVHPGHARRMAAKMMRQGHPVLFYEAKDGGHRMAVDNQGRAYNSALQTVYLMQKLMQ